MTNAIVKEKKISFKTLEKKSLCQVLVGKFPYLFLLSLFFYFFVSQISPGYALNRYFSLVAKYKIS